jgi:hypothetical protein
MIPAKSRCFQNVSEEVLLSVREKLLEMFLVLQMNKTFGDVSSFWLTAKK